MQRKNCTVILNALELDSCNAMVSKDDGLKLALEGRLHATIVHLETGIIFLRPLFGVMGFKILK
jgi:hypothetical protein